MLIQYVEPCLSHESPLLRARSLYLIAKFSDLSFVSQEFIPNVIKKVCSCIMDHYLPVKI